MREKDWALESLAHEGGGDIINSVEFQSNYEQVRVNLDLVGFILQGSFSAQRCSFEYSPLLDDTPSEACSFGAIARPRPKD